MKEEFVRRTSLAWGMSELSTERLLRTSYKTSIRINPFKVRKSTQQNIKKQYKNIDKIDWIENAYVVDAGLKRPSELPEFENGEFIIQNPASFIPVLELQPQKNEYILDMCAAPGAKSSHIAACVDNKARLVLNDTSRTRFFKMKKLMQTMGVQADYSLKDGRFLSKDYGENTFDKILLDAPCSGEANLNLDKLNNWSLSTIKRLQTLQGRLIQDAFNMLKPGGRLVYSTCTIAPEENELVIDLLLRHNTTAAIVPTNKYHVNTPKAVTSWNEKLLSPEISKCLRLLPSETVKPFFIAVITKTSDYTEDDSYEILKKHYKVT